MLSRTPKTEQDLRKRRPTYILREAVKQNFQYLNGLPVVYRIQLLKSKIPGNQRTGRREQFWMTKTDIIIIRYCELARTEMRPVR